MILKRILLCCIVLIAGSTIVLSQSALDIALNEISSDLVSKLVKKEKRKVVVLYITDINKSTTTGGKYMADFISVNIVNHPENFMVFDRDNLKEIVEAKKLEAEGYIDVDHVKELGKILAVDVIIVGNYTVMSNTIKLTLKGLDVHTGFVLAASIKDLPLDSQSGSVLGVNIESGSGDLNPHRGFNSPLNSGEQYNNPGTVSKECEGKNLGDYCFTNNFNFKVRVSIVLPNGYDSITLSPKQTQCVYNYTAKDYKYTVFNDSVKKGSWGLAPTLTEGKILVEKCKSKTIILK